jgi:hypothetical protein
LAAGWRQPRRGGNPETLDWYLKQHVARQTANYVAVLLARAKVVDLITERPARLRLSFGVAPPGVRSRAAVGLTPGDSQVSSGPLSGPTDTTASRRCM